MNPRKTGIALRLLGMGWYIALCIGGGAFGGLWLDRQLDSSPIITLLGLGAGTVVAFFGMFRMLKAILDATSESHGGREG